MRMEFLRSMPLRSKLRLIILIVSGITLLAAFIALLTFQWLSLWKTYSKDLEIMAQIVGDQSTAALEFGQKAQAVTILTSLRAQQQIAAAAVYDKEGQLFAQYGREQNARPVPQRPETDGSTTKEGELLVFLPMLSGGERIGTFYLRSDMSQIWNWLWVNLAVVGAVLAVAIGLILILSQKLGRWVTDPVLHLENVMQAVSTQKDYSIRAQLHGDDELGRLIRGFNDMLSQIQERDEALARARDELEQRVQERTKTLQEQDRELQIRMMQLEASNKELESFSYSVSHDLRSPLRAIDGFSQALLEDYATKLDEMGKQHLERIRAGSQRMSELIDGLLNIARLSRSEVSRRKLDIAAMASEIIQELKTREPNRQVEFICPKSMEVSADSQLFRAVMTNLVENAWKYSRRTEKARIELGVQEKDGKKIYFVKDNGAGFDMAYVDKLFGVFQRLHTSKEFEGTGIGLATAQRIVQRHGGRIWAEGEVGKGATLFFTLG